MIYIYSDLDGSFQSTDEPTPADLEFYHIEGLDLFRINVTLVESWNGKEWVEVPQAKLRADGYHVKGPITGRYKT